MKNNRSLPQNISSYIFGATLLSLAGLSLFYLNPYDFGLGGVSEPEKVYFADHISEVYLEIINEFNEIHEGEIEVVPVDLPFEKFTTNERKEILFRFLRGNDVIDIFVVDQIWIPRFAKWGADLNVYLHDFVRDSLITQSQQSAYYGDKLVSVPIHLDMGVMFYRKDLLQKHFDFESIETDLSNSISYERLFDIAEKHDANLPKYVFQADNYESLVCNFVELWASVNARELTSYEDIDSVSALKTLDALELLIKNSGVKRATLAQLNETSSFSYFLENHGLFLRGWPSSIMDMKSLGYSDSLLNNIGIAALPHFMEKSFIIGGWNMMISNNSTKKVEAAKFIKFLMSHDSQRKIYKSRGHVSTNINLYKTSELEKDENLRFFSNMLNYGVYRPVDKQYTRQSDILSYYLNQFVKGELTKKETIHKIITGMEQEDFILR
ncbi:MAG: hypothetical protein SCALA702_32280 [Melioribacteraceae bacterium]|nr:MAG: hypothetical protein SCALA702_32280 [Melioribacteraceae bacterium]